MQVRNRLTQRDREEGQTLEEEEEEEEKEKDGNAVNRYSLTSPR